MRSGVKRRACTIWVIIVLIVYTEVTSEAIGSEIGPGRPLEYTISEELPVGTIVGDVRQDSNITKRYREEEALLLRFSFKHPSSSSSSSSSSLSRLFSLDEVRGIIRTAQILDRDSLCSSLTSCDIALDITVKPLQYFQILKVVVHLEDINDNAPTFPESRIVISIVETALPGALFPLPTADDADSAIFGVQEYQLLSDFDGFELRVTDQVDGSKDVRLRLDKALDRETQDYYYATVMVLDGGRPPRSGSVFVDIVILDSNDNSPQFDNSSYEVSVLENLASSSTLVRVHATDRDEGANGNVLYSFSDQTEQAHGSSFGIDDHTGAIYLKRSLDYEQAQTFQLTVKAKDQGSNSMPVFAKVTVHVIDVNDNQPEITLNVLTSSGRAEVQENSDPGSFLAHIAVRDKDLGSSEQVECSIDNRALFRLEPLFASEYKIVTVMSFDREEQERYSVTITCWDSGFPVLSSSVTMDVFVTDENDHAPQISLPLYEVHLAENTPPHSVIARIEATDEDSGKNRAVHYRIRSLDHSAEGVLSLDLITGKVMANEAFDYEDRRQYTFLVTVSDQGDEPRSSTATLVLNIGDVNDESPTFDRSGYLFSTRENLPVGTVIGRVTATDRDLSIEFREIVYRLRFPSDFFEVDRISGEIVNTRRLDREVEPIHRLTVIAFNRGHRVDSDLEGRVNVTVVVEDDNDNSPVFVFPTSHSKTVQVSGTSAGVGTLVTRLVARDADAEANAQIHYEILHGDDNGHFEIGSSTGILTIAKWPLTEESGSANKVIHLVVLAKDSGSPPQATVADLVVLVNNSAQPNYAAHEGSSGHLLAGNNVAILIGALLGSIFVLACIIIAAVFVYRHRRTALQKISSPVVCEQLRPLSRAKTSCRSLDSTDSASMISAGSRGTGVPPSVPGCRRCRLGNTGGSMVLSPKIEVDEEDGYMDRIPANWPLRPSQSLRIPKRSGCGLADDGVHEKPVCQDFTSRDRRTGTGRTYPHPNHQHHHKQHQQQQQPQSRLCNSASTSRIASSRGRSDGQRTLRVTAMTNTDLPQLRLSPQGDVDAESACSYSDSGQGPSEEEDLQQLALAAAAAAAAATGTPSSTASTTASVIARPSLIQPPQLSSQRERIAR